MTHPAQAPAESGAPSRRTALIVAIPVAFSLAAYAGAISRLPITGDEPHYLIMAESVATDLDLDLRNNYEDEARRPRFYGAVAPHVGKVARGWMPFHAPGLSVLLAIPAGLAGVPGARFALIVFSCVIPWALFRWLASEMPEMTAAWLTLSTAISLPFCFGGQEIYPDLPAGACALALALWLLRRPREPANIAAWAGWSLFCGLLPWLNAKFMATTAVLAIAGMVVTYRTCVSLARPAHRSALAVMHVLPAAVAPAAMVAFNLWATGRPLGFRGAEELNTSFGRAALTLVGLHLDQSQGLFVQQPLMLAAVATLAPFARLRFRTALFWIALYASLIVPNSFEVAEFGGGGPVGRFGWSATWLWIIPLGIVLARYHDQLRRYVKPLAAVCLAYQMALAVRWGLNPLVLFPRIDSGLSARDSLFPPAMRQWLPSFYSFDVRSTLRHAPNVVAIVLVVLLLLTGSTMAMMNSGKRS